MKNRSNSANVVTPAYASLFKQGLSSNSIFVEVEVVSFSFFLFSRKKEKAISALPRLHASGKEADQ
jgi:hypothetical protein